MIPIKSILTKKKRVCIHSDYIHLKVAIELLGFAVLWPLFIDSEKWP